MDLGDNVVLWCSEFKSSGGEVGRLELEKFVAGCGGHRENNGAVYGRGAREVIEAKY